MTSTELKSWRESLGLSQRGGKRSGAGRPAATDSRRINTILPESIIERAREIGSGNVSKGLALAVAAYRDKT